MSRSLLNLAVRVNLLMKDNAWQIIVVQTRGGQADTNKQQVGTNHEQLENPRFFFPIFKLHTGLPPVVAGEGLSNRISP